MNEEIEYAEMLEIPVSTVNVVRKTTRRKKQKPQEELPENTPEQQKELEAFAKKHKLLMTGGSDFHGAYNAKPVVLGQCGPDDAHVEALMTYKAKLRRKQKKAEKEKAEMK